MDDLTEFGVRIQPVRAEDAHRETDVLALMRSRLMKHENQYPGIKRWIDNQVIPDLKTCRRVGYVGLVGEAPVLTAVLKRSDRSKFCHLSIEDGFRGNKLGQLMFSLMAAEVRSCASEIHFTLPEGLWEREKGFFREFGFDSVDIADAQYRLFEQELRCSAPFSKVWSHVRAILPTLLTTTSICGYEVNDGVVMSLEENQARAVVGGRKTVDVRAQFDSRWVGRTASVLASTGSGCLLGTVSIRQVEKGSPEAIWDRYHNEVGWSKTTFMDSCRGRKVVYAVELADPKAYRAPVPLSQLSYLTGEEVPKPRSCASYSYSDKFGKALSMAALLHGSLR